MLLIVKYLTDHIISKFKVINSCFLWFDDFKHIKISKIKSDKASFYGV